MYKIGPLCDPTLQQSDIVTGHQLEATAKIGLDPAIDKCQAVRHHAALLTKAAVYSLRILITKLLNHHKQHRSLFQLLQNFSCGICSRAASQSHSGMRTRPAQIQIRNRSLVARPIKQWPHREELIKRQLPVEDVTPSEPISVLQILRRNDLVREDQLRQVRSILRQCLNQIGRASCRERV